MSTAQQEARQLRPIYEALDTANFKLAIQLCNKILKKQPNFDIVKALKALALARNAKSDEASAICNELLASKPTDEVVLSALSHVLRNIGRPEDMTAMYDDAFKRKPNNEDLGAQTFMANVRVGHWKTAQQVALRMFKQFKDDRFLFWSVMSSVLQAEHPLPNTPTPLNFRSVLYTLALRLLKTHPTATSSSPYAASLITPDRLFLHLSILLELKQFDEALTLFETEAGKNICSTSLVIQDLRKRILVASSRWDLIETAAKGLLVDKKDRNWLVFLTFLECIFHPLEYPNGLVLPTNTEVILSRVEEARELFLRLSEDDGTEERGSALASIELEARARKHGLGRDPMVYVQLLKDYYHKFGDKVCCFEDLKPYLDLKVEETAEWISFLNSQSPSTSSINEVNRLINLFKLRRTGLSVQDISPESESTLAQEYYKAYIDALPLGKDLPVTELQPADDLAILAGQAFVSAWYLRPGDHQHLIHALCIFEYASSRSKHSWKLRLLLIRIHRLLGSNLLALEHYRAMNVKQVQNDTLSHYILARASTYSLAHNGDLTMLNECLEASHVYSANSTETVELIVQTFQYEKYSQIQDFITFEDRLDNSLQRDLIKMEHVRMRFTCEPPLPEVIDMELVELKFILERTHHDNRDFTVLPDFQPQGQTFERMTAMGGNSPGWGWCQVFLKIYIRTLSHASDLTASPEGAAKEAEKNMPLLSVFSQEETDDLTEHEKALLNFTSNLSNWLEPHHAFTKYSGKGKDIANGNSTSNGTSNGPPKSKHEQVLEPSVQSKEIPQDVTNSFEDLISRFDQVVAKSSLPWEILHVASLIQEAFILFNIETLRFNPPPGAKTKRADSLIQNIKPLRAKGLAAVKHVAEKCLRLSEEEATPERRQKFVEGCALVSSHNAPDNAFVMNVGRKVADTRKKVFESMGKGILRTCSS